MIMLAVPVTALLQLVDEHLRQRARQRVLKDLELRPVVGLPAAEWHKHLSAHLE